MTMVQRWIHSVEAVENSGFGILILMALGSIFVVMKYSCTLVYGNTKLQLL
jgi:hypothetical protein